MSHGLSLCAIVHCDGIISWVDAATGEFRRTVEVAEFDTDLTCVAISPDNRYWLTGGGEMYRVWRATGGAASQPYTVRRYRRSVRSQI
jgi:hypothetical protein